MKKLALVLDDLRVESFDTTTEVEPRGTVHGHSGGDFSVCYCSVWWEDCVTPVYASCHHTCHGKNTCAHTCDYFEWTCDNSCYNGTCYDASCYGTCQDSCDPQICP